MDNKLVVVLSRIYSTGLSVVRSLGTAGFTVDMIASSVNGNAFDAVKCSKYINEFIEVATSKFEEESDTIVLEQLLKYKEKNQEKIVLFPTDDYSASVMDRHKEVLSSIFLMPSLKDDSLYRFMNKSLQNQTARKFGLPTPNEIIVSLRDEEKKLPEGITYPCFCKPIASVVGLKTEMAKCDNEEDLKKHLDMLRNVNPSREVLVQEFLEIEEEIDLSGVCLDQQVIIPAVTKKLAVGKHKKGVVLLGEIVSKDIVAEALNKVTEMLKSIHYIGMFHMDLNIVDGDVYFGELNLRSGGPNYIYYHCGVNLPEIFVNYMLGKKPEEEQTIIKELNKTFVYEEVAWYEYLNEMISRKELDKYLEEADYTLLFNDDDKAPGEMFNQNMIKKEGLLEIRKHCIANAMNTAGWDKETAKSKIKISREITGISYSDYDKYGFALVPIVEHKAILQQIEKDRKSEACINDDQVAVVTRNYTAGIGAIRTLGTAEYDISLAVSAFSQEIADITSSSKYLGQVKSVIAPKDRSYRDPALVGKLLSFKKNFAGKIVLLPCDDYSLSVIERNKELLSNFYILPSIENGDLLHINEKNEQEKLARAGGFLTSLQWVVALDDEIQIPDDLCYPCFCKAFEDDSDSLKEIVCENEIALRERFSQLYDIFGKKSIIVEQKIMSDKTFYISGVCACDKIILPGLIEEIKPSHTISNTFVLGRLISFDNYEKLYNMILEMMKSIKYSGVFDLKILQKGEHLYLDLISFSFGPTSDAYSQCGCNLIKQFIDTLTNQEVSCPKIEFGKVIVNENAVWKEYGSEYIHKGEIEKTIKQGEICIIKNEDDEKPYENFEKFITEKVAQTRRKNKKKKIRRIVGSVRKVLSPLLGPIKRLFLRYPQYKPSNKRNPNSEKPRVMVAGRSFGSNLCMARSMGRAGYDVEVLRIFQKKPRAKNIMKWMKPDAYSKYVKAYYVCVSGKGAKRVVERLISLADPDRKMLFVPVDDVVGAIIDDYYDELSPYYVLPNINNKAGEINRLMNKTVQKELAAAAGIPVIKSCIIETVNGEFKIPDSVDYPCFIKPNISKNSFKTKMRRCDSKEELREALIDISMVKDIEMIVEDYIDIDKEYSILGLCTREGVMGPGFFVATEGGQNEHRGVAMTGQMLPCEIQQELIDQINTFVGTLNYEGLYDIDLIGSTSGKMYFVEINMRYGGSGFAVTDSGLNLPGMYADYVMLGKPIDYSLKLDNPNKTFVNEKMLIDEYVKARITREKIDRLINECDIHFIIDKDDPKPYKHFKKFYWPASKLREVAIKREKQMLEEEKVH